MYPLFPEIFSPTVGHLEPALGNLISGTAETDGVDDGAELGIETACFVTFPLLQTNFPPLFMHLNSLPL